MRDYIERDPARIERINRKLATLWHMHPDQRLGQLVVNVTGREDPFYFGDDEVERRIDAAIEHGLEVAPTYIDWS